MRHISLTLIAAVPMLILGLASCKPSASPGKEENPEKEPEKEVVVDTLFFDDFDSGATLPDDAVWRPCTYANNAWSQHFTPEGSLENVSIEDGVLKLRADKGPDGKYRTSGIRTKKGFPAPSRLAVRARLSKQVRGAFPAIWQMPVGGEQWPRSGEIDLMEWVQGTPKQIYQTVHTYYINGASGSSGKTNPNPDKNFDVTKYHVYAADRTEDAVIFYVDGRETWRYKRMNIEDPQEAKYQFPFCDLPFDVILNFSLGGTLNGNNTWAGPIADEDLPGELLVDWVCVTALD